MSPVIFRLVVSICSIKLFRKNFLAILFVFIFSLLTLSAKNEWPPVLDKIGISNFLVYFPRNIYNVSSNLSFPLSPINFSTFHLQK